MSAKAGDLINFDEGEKEAWIKTYFKKYYMEHQVLKEQTVRLKIDIDQAAKKRQCSCTVGHYDRTGKLIPTGELEGKEDRYITVKM